MEFTTSIQLFKIVLLVVFLILGFPRKFQFYLATFLLILAIIITQTWALWVLVGTSLNLPFLGLFNYPIYLTIDPLSALMISLINFVCLGGWFYGKGYLKYYFSKRSSTEMAWHYFNYLWLYLAMLLVVMLRDGFAFLFAWEIMSLASFFLVIFEYEKKENHYAAISYFIQMHVGLIFLLLGFVWGADERMGFGFDSIELFMSRNSPMGIFLLFFVGFGLKAGYIPLHTWLPQAHPSAPSHISGVMSGIMIKMGIYGIIRIMQALHSDYFPIGLIILSFSMLSSIGGITLASVQSDLKKVLAYSSIENIGIIGIGLGLALIGIAKGSSVLAILGYTGTLFHMMNHALFKPLLFYGAGNIYQQFHHRNLEKMGGVARSMPKTAFLFFLGCIAISGIPPFNGFVSELILYLGIFKTFNFGDLPSVVVGLFVIAALVLTGGLAAFAFLRLFSVVFQGHPRANTTHQPQEVNAEMLLPMGFIVLIILSIGIFPLIAIYLPLQVAGSLVKDVDTQIPFLFNTLRLVGWVAISVIILSSILWVARKMHLAKYGQKFSATWGCGYVNPKPQDFQYTASSQSYYLHLLAPFFMGKRIEYRSMEEKEFFPTQRQFSLKISDVIWVYMVLKPARFMAKIMQSMAIFHTGRIQTYLLYALIFIAMVGFLTLLNII